MKQSLLIALLATAAIGSTPFLSCLGCYPHDWNPSTPVIDAPSPDQTGEAADALAAAAATAAHSAGRPDLIVLLDALARVAVVVGAWFISRTYAGKPITLAPKE